MREPRWRIGAMLAWERGRKWRRGRGRVLAPLSGHRAWEALADEMVRAMRSLETEVRMYRDENEAVGVIVLARGVDPAFKLRPTGRTTGDVETGHLEGRVMERR